MKTRIISYWALFLLSFVPSIVMSQDVSSEVPIVVDNGVLKSTRIIVAFNRNVIPTDSATTVVDTTRFPIQDIATKVLIHRLSARYGPLKITKRVPRRVWGDTLVVNRRTGEVSTVPDMSQALTLDFASPVPIDSVILAFLELSVVKYADQPISIHWLTNDSLFSSQWNLQTIQAPLAWNITTGSASKKIAIIDQSGSNSVQNHPDFQLAGGGNKFVGGDGSTCAGHAFWEAGIAGAATNNTTGVASLGWNTSLLGYFFNEGDSNETKATLPYQIDLAVSAGADLINFSFETLKRDPQSGKDCPHDYQEVRDEIAYAAGQGVVLVAAAGNGSIVGCTNGQVPYVSYPASYDGVIAVSGTTQSDQFQDTFNYGNFVALAAPSEGIWGPYPLTTYQAFGGTSASAPQVCALGALILAVNPTADVGMIMQNTADKVDASRYPYTNGWNSHLGYGRINAFKALALANGAPAAPQNLQVGAHKIQSNPPLYCPKLTWNANTEADMSTYKIYRALPSRAGYYNVIATVSHPTTQYIDNIIQTGNLDTAFYKVTAVDTARLESGFSNLVWIQTNVTSKPYGSEGKDRQTPSAFALEQNYPNPFNPTSRMKYQLAEDANVALRLYEILGREIRTLVEEQQQAGYYELTVDGSRLATGVYFVRLVATDQLGRIKFSGVNKLIVMN